MIGAVLLLILVRRRNAPVNSWDPPPVQIDPQALPRLIKAFEEAQAMEINLESASGRIGRGSQGFMNIIEVIQQARPEQPKQGMEAYLSYERIVTLVNPDGSKTPVDAHGPNLRMPGGTVTVDFPKLRSALEAALTAPK